MLNNVKNYSVKIDTNINYLILPSSVGSFSSTMVMTSNSSQEGLWVGRRLIWLEEPIAIFLISADFVQSINQKPIQYRNNPYFDHSNLDKIGFFLASNGTIKFHDST